MIRVTALLVLLAAYCAPAAAVVIDMTGAQGTVCCFGDNSPYDNPIDSFGQTFRVPEGNGLLENFSFQLIPPQSSSESVSFRAYVSRWSADGHPIGPALYQSDITTLAGLDTIPGPTQTFQFSTSGLHLEDSVMYIAYLSPANEPSGFENLALYPGGSSDVYADQWGDGGWVWLNHATAHDDLTSLAWNVGKEDTAFAASFATATPIPEPSSLWLVALALAGLVVAGKLRSRRATAAL